MDWDADDDVQAIPVSAPFYEHRAHTTPTTRFCCVCGARLRRTNRTDRCSCHVPGDYRPQHDPDAPGRLLAHFQANEGQVVHPLRDAFRMACYGQQERSWVLNQIRTLRRRGHSIIGYPHSGGYVYQGRTSCTGGAGADSD